MHNSLLVKPYLPVGSRRSGRSGVRCITLGSGLGGGRTAPRCSRCSPRLGGAADGGGRRRGGTRQMDGGGLVTYAICCDHKFVHILGSYPDRRLHQNALLGSVVLIQRIIFQKHIFIQKSLKSIFEKHCARLGPKS